MEFIKLESRGGNYLVVADNIAWLRTAENGQTTVGIVGGQPLLVVGSIEDVAATILAATQQKQAAPTPVAAAPAAAPAPEPVAEPASAATAPEPPVATAEAESTPPMPAPQRLRASPVQSSTLADRLARAAAPSIKAGTQRLMTISEAS